MPSTSTSILRRTSHGFPRFLRRFSNGLVVLHHPLRVLVHFFLRLRSGRERPKPALQHSLWIALCRSAIHLPAIFISGFLIWINYYHYFIGSGFSRNNSRDSIYLALYQIASKMHECNIPPTGLGSDVSDKSQCSVLQA